MSAEEVGLAEAIADLRRELTTALQAGQEEALRFKLGPVELIQLEVAKRDPAQACSEGGERGRCYVAFDAVNGRPRVIRDRACDELVDRMHDEPPGRRGREGDHRPPMPIAFRYDLDKVSALVLSLLAKGEALDAARIPGLAVVLEVERLALMDVSERDVREAVQIRDA